MEMDFATARLRALDPVEGWPFLASALYAITPVVTADVPTLGTDRHWRTYVNPVYINSITADQAAAVVVHEVWHLLGGTFERAEAYGVLPEERGLWNYSTDAELNAKRELRDRLPPGAIHYKTLGCEEDLFAEQVMDHLRKNPPPPPPQPGGPGSGNCGSCAHGHPEPYELPGPGEGVPGVTPAQAQILQAVTAAAIVEHASRGTVPAGWLLWAKRIFHPKVDYRQVVFRAVMGAAAPFAGSAVSAPRRIGRRTPADPRLPSPGSIGRIATLAVIVDTSGSVVGRGDVFSQVLGEVAGVLRALGYRARVTVYFTDAAAAPAQHAFRVEDLRPVGGGGTDMREGFAAIVADAAKDPRCRPDLIICLTDGETPWPEQPPRCDTLTVLVGDGGAGPSWAGHGSHKLVRIDPTP